MGEDVEVCHLIIDRPRVVARGPLTDSLTEILVAVPVRLQHATGYLETPA